MDEYQDYVKFDENGERDFEDGQWIDGEFVARGLKRGRQQSKEDAIYGVFGEDSDDDQRAGKRGMERKESNFTRPVGFVSKGVDNGSKEDDEYNPVEVRPAGGLGFQPSFASASRMEQQEEDDDENEVLATALGSRIKKQVAERRQTGLEEREMDKQWQQVKSADPSFATFEKHTKGIGMKLLAKMGFKPGEGLGAGKGGIAKPIEVQVRPKGQALGFGSRHRDTDEEDDRARGSNKASTSAAEASAPEMRGGAAGGGGGGGGGRMWKKKNKEARTRREYRTADEVVSEASKNPQGAPTLNPILDMRGPRARLLTSLDCLNDHHDLDQDLHHPSNSGKGKMPMPELQHNLQLLVDLCESGIQKLDSQLRHEEDTRVLLEREVDRHLKDSERVRVEVERVNRVLRMVERFQPVKQSAGKGTSALGHGRVRGGMVEDEGDGLGRPTYRKTALPPPPSLKEAEDAFRELLSSYREEYIMYRLSTIALAHILPGFKAIFSNWRPLEEPERGLAEFKAWRPLLETPRDSSSSSIMGGLGRSSNKAGVDEDSYLGLVWEVFLPPVRNACVSSWQARDPEPLLTLLESWSGLLPPAAMSHVLQLIVVPRLSAAVDEWEPRKDSVMIHTWLHPWLPLLGPQVEGLYPSIRHKLSVALQLWHPSDPSAFSILEPWSNAFSSSDWEGLMMKSIVPKLAMALQQLVIDPTSQELAPFEWVISWHNILPLGQMVSLLSQGFFPKWHKVLSFWLSHSPDYDEVTRWYLGWKSLFPSRLLEQTKVKHQFNLALNAMNSAIDGKPTHAPSEARPAAQMPLEDDDEEEEVRPYIPPSDLTLRELVQKFAEERGVEFMPKFGRFHDGLQIYSFGGKVNVILENTTSMVRAQVKDKWVPASLESLLQQAAAK